MSLFHNLKLKRRKVGSRSSSDGGDSVNAELKADNDLDGAER